MSIWDAAKEILGLVAPALGTAVGGPLGGVAARELASALGLAADASQDAIATAVAGATPEQLAAIKQAEIAFQTRMRELDIDLERIHQQDRDSARQREIATHDKTPAILAYLVTAGFFSVLGYQLVYGVPAHGGEALLVMLGALGSAWAGVISYFFGSSVGSKQKSAELTAMGRR